MDFLQRQTRKADRTGCVTVDGSVFEVGPALARQRVELRFDPYDLKEIQVWHQGNKVGMARPLDLTARREVVDAEQPAVEPKSGLNYLQLLRQEQEQALQRKIQGLSFQRMMSQQEGK